MKTKKFTLTELLIVGSILAIGATVTTPLLHTAQENAVACIDNSRRLGVGIMNYSETYDGYFPPTQLLIKMNGERPYWSFLLVKNKFITIDALICPEGESRIADPWAEQKVKELKSDPAINKDAYVYTFYGYNVMGIGGGNAGQRPVKVSACGNNIILTADSWDGNNYSIARYIGSYGIYNKLIKGHGLVNPLHEGKATVLWSDGRATPEVGGHLPHEVWKHGVFSHQEHWIPQSIH